MKVIKTVNITFVPASHEDLQDPGVLKKVLFKREEITSGWIQMINWCKLLPKRSFEAHFHETMDEIFIITNGRVLMKAGDESVELSSGDAVYIPEKTIHTMDNLHSSTTEYIAIGIAKKEGGKSVNV
jgi:mannose-6-phosphate isomerase-like protein (cupin superfamily)